MSARPSGNQTLTFLLRRFREVGIRPHTKSGQHFLIDPNLQRLLLRTAALEADDVVLEVGTGTGSLTALMAPQAAAVVTVEIDRQLFQLATEELHGLDNVTILLLDALKGKNRLNPEVLEAVDRRLAGTPGRRWKLVANLPFNVATPILTNLLALDSPPETMTVTIQKELAERIVAPPGTKDYGSLSIWLQSQCLVEIVRVLSPEVFWPRPKVASAIVQITLKRAMRARIPDRDFFHEFVRSMFLHRRKLLRSGLLSGLNNRLEKPQVDRILVRMGLEPTARAEQLDPEQMLALCEAVRAELSD